MALIEPCRLEAFWQHPKWWQLSNEHLFDSQLALITVVDAQGALIAALPVKNNTKLLSFPQHDHLTVIDSIWAASIDAPRIEQVMDATLSHFKASGWNSLNLPTSSPMAQCHEHPHWQWREVRQSAWFDTQSEDVPIPGKLRRNLARHERHLQETGELSFSSVNAKDADGIEQAMGDFLQLEAAGWKGESGTAVAADPTLRAFYLGLKSFNTLDLLFEIHRLYHQDRCIAVQIGIRCGSTRYLLKIAYDEAYAASSPGSLMLWRTLQDCANSDTETLSLVTAPPWAARWKPKTFPVWHVTRFSNNLQGSLHLHTGRLKNGLKDRLRATRNRIKP